MTSTLAERVTEIAPMIRELERWLVRDKSYRQVPVGRDVGRWVRALRWEGLAQNTLDSYEYVGAMLALDHADFAEGLARFCAPDGTEYLREFLDRRWGGPGHSPATRAQRTAVIKSLFRWATGEGIIPWDPSTPLRARAGQARVRRAHERDTIRQLLRQPSDRDSCALHLVVALALRREDLRLLKIGDIDLARNLVALRHRKGGQVRLLDLADHDLQRALYLHIQAGQRRPSEYLLYPRGNPAKPMDRATVHRWFKRCLTNAGLPDMELHELRHTAGTAVWRQTGDVVKAQHVLGHARLDTTMRYLHVERDDVRAGLAALASWLRNGDDGK